MCGKEGGSWVDSEIIRMSFRFGVGKGKEKRCLWEKTRREGATTENNT